MEVNLFINFYIDSNKRRRHEINSCLAANIALEQIDNIYLFTEEQDIKATRKLINGSKKVKLYLVSQRPVYNDYFKMTRECPDDINIISNSDIIMCGPSINKLKQWRWRRFCIALSRWDLLDGLDTTNVKLYYHADSQDTWIVKGGFPHIERAQFPLGVAGCDNRIAFELNKRFKVINPSQEIKTFHYHTTGIRNYHNEEGKPKETISPPYLKIRPSRLP